MLSNAYGTDALGAGVDWFKSNRPDFLTLNPVVRCSERFFAAAEFFTVWRELNFDPPLRTSGNSCDARTIFITAVLCRRATFLGWGTRHIHVCV